MSEPGNQTANSPALAAQQQREIQSLRGYMLNEAQIRLEPAEPEEIIDQLTPVLALVGASGMTQDDRAEWLAAAADALKDIPRDLLMEALRECRRRADHPSKVIPFVADYCEERIRWRKRDLERSSAALQPKPMQITDNERRLCSGEEASQIIDEVIPWVRNGTERVNEPTDRGPPRMPTRADYIALGVDPAVLPGRKE